MCITNSRLDRKSRRLKVIANLSFVIGLLLWLFVHPAGQIERDWVHGMSGFLLGLYITMNLLGFGSAGRCRETEEGA